MLPVISCTVAKVNDVIKPGKFITLEGGEGVGKTTNLAFIVDYLQQRGIAAVATREPGGTALGERIRDLLLHGQDMSADTELLLMFAARAAHLSEVIKPALAKGVWVICDRFTDATYAYQGGGRGIPTERISALETWVQGDFRPDQVLVLDASLAVSAVRRRQRNQSDRFEREQETFFQQVRNVYLQRAKLPTYRLIDASRSLEEVQASLKQAVDALISEID